MRVIPEIVFVDGDRTYEKVLEELRCIIDLWGVPIEESVHHDANSSEIQNGDSEDGEGGSNTLDDKNKTKRETVYTIAGCGYEHEGVRRAVLEISMKYNMPDTNSSWTYTPINRRKVQSVEWIKDVQNKLTRQQFDEIFNICNQPGDKVSVLQWKLKKGSACYTVRKYVNHFHRKTRKTWLMAVDNNNINIANTLINAYGADVNQANEERLTALHIAAYNKNRNIALLLLKNGADRSVENKWGEKPDETARARGEENLANLIQNYTEKIWDQYCMTFSLAPVTIEKEDEDGEEAKKLLNERIKFHSLITQII